MILANPSRAYAYALHSDMDAAKPGFASDGDVSRALKLLEGDGILTSYVDQNTPNASQPKVYYKPTWKAAFYMALADRKADAEFKKAA
jgi:hypothetical protein